jgi:biopolymer transport protein ExbD
MILRHQFSLRTLFFIVTVCALMSVLWRSRPPRELRVELTAQGTTFVHDDEVLRSSLPSRIDREAFIRRMWRMEGVMILHAHPSVSHQDLEEVITQSQRAGFKEFVLRTAEAN